MDKLRFFSLLIFLILIVGCTKDIPEGYSLYEDETNDYSFVVPSDWQKTSLDGSDVAFMSSDQGMLLALKTVALNNNQDIYSEVKSNLLNKLDNAVILKEEDLIISDKEARELFLYYEGGDDSFRYEFILVNDQPNNKAFMISFTVDFDNREDGDRIFSQILASFDF